MVAGVETPVESAALAPTPARPSLEVRLLGPLTISRDGVALALPASRKVRALLRLSGAGPASRRAQPAVRAAVGRAQRSARRAALVPQQDQEPRRRARPAQGRRPRRTPSGSTCRTASSMRSRSPARRRRASRRLRPSGCERLPRCSPATFSKAWRSTAARLFNGWLTAQRRRFRGCHAALLEHLVSSVPDDEAFGYLEKWLQLAPFDRRVHEILLNALARRGRIREGEEHLAATARLFEAEGLDCTPIRDAWRRRQGAGRWLAAAAADRRSTADRRQRPRATTRSRRAAPPSR